MPSRPRSTTRSTTRSTSSTPATVGEPASDPKGEHAIQEAIREDLGLVDDLVLWRNNVGVAKHWDPASGRVLVVRYGLFPGSADLVGILAPSGRLFCLEVKRSGQKPSPEQLAWGAIVQRMGGFWATVSSVSQARDALARARRGEAA